MSESTKNQKNSSRISFDQKSIIFKKLINEGPFYICVVCQRCLYKKSIFCYDENKFQSQMSSFNLVRSFNVNLYICRTCCINCLKGKVPCQVVSNKLEVFDLPVKFQSIRKLEKVLIAKLLLFKKVTIMPSGQMPKIFGTICNAPVDTIEVADVLPCSADSNGLVYVKRKRKLEYPGHVLFEPVRKMFLERLLRFLKENNPLYFNIVVKTESILPHLSPLNVFDDSCKQQIDNGFVVNNVVYVQEMLKDVNFDIPIFIDDKEEIIEEAASYSDEYSSIANETCLVSLNPQTSVDNDCINKTPGEGKQSKSILNVKILLFHIFFLLVSLVIELKEM